MQQLTNVDRFGFTERRRYLPDRETRRKLEPIIVTLKGPGIFYNGDRTFNIYATGSSEYSALLTRGWDTLEFPGCVTRDGAKHIHRESGIVLWCRHVAPNEEFRGKLSAGALEELPPGLFIQAEPREPSEGEAVVAFQRTTYPLHRCADGDTCPMIGDCRSSGRCALSTPANPVFGPWMYRCDYERLLEQVPGLGSGIPHDYPFPPSFVPGYLGAM